MAAGTKGKRGGARVIYFLATEEVIYFIMAYPKNTKDNLTESEKAELKKLTSVLKYTASNAVNKRCTMYSNKAGGG